MNIDSLVLHGFYRSDESTSSVAVPIYMTTAYELEGDMQDIADIYNVKKDGFTYSRIINPTTRILERRFAMVDKSLDSLALSSGQAATAISLLNLCGNLQKSNIITTPYLYGNSWNLLHKTFKRFGIEVRVADPLKPSTFKEMIDDNTVAIYGESISNPTLIPLPIEYLADLSKAYGVALIVDNTITPLCICPSELGATLVNYSATKYICGHGTTLGGLIVDTGNSSFQDTDRYPLLNTPDEAHGDIVWKEVIEGLNDLGDSPVLLKARMTWLRDMGACISPFNSFQMIQGLESLPLRMKMHCQNTQMIAEFLSEHPKVKNVVYPSLFEGQKKEICESIFKHNYGYGAMIMFELEGGEDAGRKLIQEIKMAYHVSNVGDTRTLITHPVSTTHRTVPKELREKVGIYDGSIRLCVGIESFEDIKNDLLGALECL